MAALLVSEYVTEDVLTFATTVSKELVDKSTGEDLWRYVDKIAPAIPPGWQVDKREISGPLDGAAGPRTLMMARVTIKRIP